MCLKRVVVKSFGRVRKEEKLKASVFNSKYSFDIIGVSYIGLPKPYTAMYVTKKIESKLENLREASNCVVFVEEGTIIPEGIEKNNLLIMVSNPQIEYAKFAQQIEKQKFEEESRIAYRIVDGSYISETAKIGKGAHIEPGCRIGHSVVIGNNARILTGSVINNAFIGENFLSNEYAVIGGNGFTIAEDSDGNRLRIPSLGHIVIGDNVEVGAHDNISRGSAGDTILENNVKLDAFVYIGHDAVLHKNVEATAGVIVGGFDEIGEGAFIGLNAILRNRIKIGSNVIIGMGAVVTKSVEDNLTVIGNPASSMIRD